MTELDVDVLAMALVEKNYGNKRWVIHAKRDDKHYKITLRIGGDQERLIDAETAMAMELPCS